ncbi:MAG: alpha-ketoacid dehydrogenase subunit beta [Oligoflexia bacterium]|nr:alpha-ketoacid dehydrogenase subunit beta [Oligoflexia bacterium]
MQTNSSKTQRKLSYAKALVEATDICMERDPKVIMFGLGVNDPKRIFGTVGNLPEKYGKDRIFDVPLSENALTGIAVGAATMGYRAILTHQRLDFALLSLDQIINNAAKWHYMFAGQWKCPIVIRMIIGRGWGQGPQHSQSLQAIFAHIPGLKVVMPATPADAKGLFIASVEDSNPVIFLEHRWLHYLEGEVPDGYYSLPLGKSQISLEGNSVTLVASSYMVYESYRAAEALKKIGISAEVINLQTVSPLDLETIIKSVKKTGHLVVADTGHASFGVPAEIISRVTENCFSALKSAPVRIACPDYPAPTTFALAKHYYPRSSDIAEAVLKILGESNGFEITNNLKNIEQSLRPDVPDLKFTGPF